AHVLLVPGSEVVLVQGVRVEPVDGGEVAALGELRVERPEALDDAQRVLRDGLREVAARGADGADDGDGAELAVARLDAAGALVELGEARGKVGGVALLAGHLFETAGDLTHGL